MSAAKVRLLHLYCIPARACRAVRIDNLNHHSISSDISRFRHIENNFSVCGAAVAFGARIGRRIVSGATAVTPDGEPIAYEAGTPRSTFVTLRTARLRLPATKRSDFSPSISSTRASPCIFRPNPSGRSCDRKAAGTIGHKKGRWTGSIERQGCQNVRRLISTARRKLHQTPV
jgi:hypothetical protein